jgi:hypothetical protein
MTLTSDQVFINPAIRFIVIVTLFQALVLEYGVPNSEELQVLN